MILKNVLCVNQLKIEMINHLTVPVLKVTMMKIGVLKIVYLVYRDAYNAQIQVLVLLVIKARITNLTQLLENVNAKKDIR